MRRHLAMGLVGLGLVAALGCLQAPQSVVPAPSPGAGDRQAYVARFGPAEAQIVVAADHVLHAASPYVNGFNRNHVQRQFSLRHADRGAMIAATRRLIPRWGGAYMQALRQNGYAAAARGIYRTGHGPTDGRTDYKRMTGYRFQELWNRDGLADAWDGYPYDDVRYAMREAVQMGAAPLVTLNFGTDTAESAGQLAGYLNDPASPLRRSYPLSAFALPDDQGLGASMFEVGNEVQLAVERGHERAPTVSAYVAAAAPYIRAVRAASPQPVKVALAAAVNVFWGGNGQWSEQADMIDEFVAAAQAQHVRFDALQYHGYPLYPVTEKLAGNAYAEQLFRRELMPAIARAPWPLEVWDDELHAASGARNTGMYGALYAADAVATAFRLSQGGRQLIPVTVDFAWWHPGQGNGDDSLYFQNDDASQLTPVYHFRRLLAENWGDWIVDTRLVGVGAWRDVGADGEVTEVTDLSVAAAKSADGKHLYLLVVNRSREDETVGLALTGFTPTRHVAAMRRIAGQGRLGWDARWNQVDVHENLTAQLDRPVEFPPASITFLVVE